MFSASDFMDEVIEALVSRGLVVQSELPKEDPAALAAVIIGRALPPSVVNGVRSDEDRCKAAAWHLRKARDLLAQASARRSLLRVRLALSSTKGAIRNASLKPFRKGTGQELRS